MLLLSCWRTGWRGIMRRRWLRGLLLEGCSTNEPRLFGLGGGSWLPRTSFELVEEALEAPRVRWWRPWLSQSCGSRHLGRLLGCRLLGCSMRNLFTCSTAFVRALTGSFLCSRSLLGCCGKRSGRCCHSSLLSVPLLLFLTLLFGSKMLLRVLLRVLLSALLLLLLTLLFRSEMLLFRLLRALCSLTLLRRRLLCRASLFGGFLLLACTC